ncbi:MAG TPA: hypothetical protein VF881_05870 [Polyangiaceae bacterium]
MPGTGSHLERVALLLASPRVSEKKTPRAVDWPISYPEPADLTALYRACDGLTLEDGVQLLGRGELRDVTEWLVLEKGLTWPDDLVVVGERPGGVIVLDLDVGGARAGGGVLDVAADGLGAFERVASGVLSYLVIRAGVAEDEAPPPEVAARRAAAEGDRLALARELSRPMYPGQGELFASLCLELGALWAEVSDAERALSAFTRSVEARVAAVGAGLRVAARASAWRAAAHASRARGAEAIAGECERRALA